jgi:hydrogenase expression/formation protein HypE
MSDIISLAHGSGGEASKKLIDGMIKAYLTNPILEKMDDSAVIDLGGLLEAARKPGASPSAHARLAFTTDSYVVSPIFFPGGDIGWLAVNGTVNDLAMVGASPVALTLSLILEEGLEVAALSRVLGSIKAAAARAQVKVVGGDTKVVERGSADRMFVNTSGIGLVPAGVDVSSSNARAGDVVILSGSIGDHGIAVLSKRAGIGFAGGIVSDTAPLNGLVAAMLAASLSLHTMRDPTRGGLATALNEIARRSGVGIILEESAVPVNEAVAQAGDLLGLDVFYIANEGKLVAFVPEAFSGPVLEAMRRHEYGRASAVIGRVVDEHPGMVVLNTSVGGRRILSPLSGELLPRIC